MSGRIGVDAVVFGTAYPPNGRPGFGSRVVPEWAANARAFGEPLDRDEPQPLPIEQLDRMGREPYHHGLSYSEDLTNET